MSVASRPPPIGMLRRRVILESFTRTSDGAGGSSNESWAPAAVLWAAVHPRAGGETFTADRMEGRVTHDVWIRPNASIVPGQRLRLTNRILNIRAVMQPDPFVNRMRLDCEERDL